MDAERLLEKVQKRFTLDQVKSDEVETVSVITVEDLDALISGQVKDRSAQLAAELKQMRTRIAELESESNNAGGLERAAAEAALEAESRALEEKATAELRAEKAEAQARDLEARLAAGGAPVGAPSGAVNDGKETARANAAEARAAEAEARAKDLAGKVAALEVDLAKAKAAPPRAAEKPSTPTTKPVAKPEAKVEAKPEAKVEAKPEAKVEAKPEAKPAEPAKPKTEAITADEHKRARRLIDALLDDLWSDQEDRAKKAVAARTFRADFATELDAVKKQVVKRVKAQILTEKDHWEDALKALEAR